MLKHPDFIAVVLAGGQSRRMGTDKASLQVENQSMLELSKQKLLQTGAKRVLISRNSGNEQHIEDIYQGAGPLGGIHAVLHANPKENLLVVPVDLPLIKAQDLTRLVQVGCTIRCSTYFTGHHLPLYLHNRPSNMPILVQQLTAGRSFSVGKYLDNINAMNIANNRPEGLFNTNNPNQWQYALTCLNECKQSTDNQNKDKETNNEPCY